MRDINRIDTFTSEFAEIWKKEFPDWRFGQLMTNFLEWVYSTKRVDPFFPEEDKMLEYFKEFAGYTE